MSPACLALRGMKWPPESGTTGLRPVDIRTGRKRQTRAEHLIFGND